MTSSLPRQVDSSALRSAVASDLDPGMRLSSLGAADRPILGIFDAREADARRARMARGLVYGAPMSLALWAALLWFALS